MEPEHENEIEDVNYWINKFLGKKYVFDDGDMIEVVQVKRRETGPWVTYHITQGPGIPRKLLMVASEFNDTYGHLFK